MSNLIGLILEAYSQLSEKEKVAVMAKLTERAHQIYSINSVSAAAELAKKYSECIHSVSGIWPITKKRDAETTICKEVLVNLLRNKGFTYSCIGKVIQLDHTTALWHYKKSLDYDNYPKLCPEYNRIKEEVTKLLDSDAL